MQCMALHRYKIISVYVCLSVCPSVCPSKVGLPIALDRDRSFCPIFLKFGM